MEEQNNSLWGVIKQYFNSLPDKNEERDTISQITDGISFKGSNLWILIFAILIASLGLNVNSTAVIIGAMLISPLMGPITGMGLSIGINDLQFLKRSFKNYLVMVVIAVITATLYFLITPLKEAQSELLSRTSPTLYDVLIAICGGAAGIIALYQGQRQCDSWCSHRNGIDATSLYGWIWLSISQLELLLGCLLPIFYQYRIYQPFYLCWCEDVTF